jgi:hypothetical protein
VNATFDHERWEELAVAHALDALEPSEDATFVAHLDSCARCQGVVAEMTAVAGDLALTADSAEPPAALREALLDAVKETPQERQPARIAPAVRVQRESGGLAGEHAVEPLKPPVELASRRRSGEHIGRWLVAAAAGVALVLGLGFVATYDCKSPAKDDSVAQAFGRCLDTSGCTPIRLVGSDGKVLAAVLVRGNRAEVVSERLAPNPADSTSYVLWAQHTAGPVKPVGVFDVTSGGASAHELDQLPWKISDISAFMVSREAGNVAPASGSAPVAQGTVSS